MTKPNFKKLCSRSTSFSAPEEMYIIHLKEQQPPGVALSWDEIQGLHKKRFGVNRSRGGLQVHYSRSLQPGKPRRKQLRLKKSKGYDDSDVDESQAAKQDEDTEDDSNVDEADDQNAPPSDESNPLGTDSDNPNQSQSIQNASEVKFANPDNSRYGLRKKGATLQQVDEEYSSDASGESLGSNNDSMLDQNGVTFAPSQSQRNNASATRADTDTDVTVATTTSSRQKRKKVPTTNVELDEEVATIRTSRPKHLKVSNTDTGSGADQKVQTLAATHPKRSKARSHDTELGESRAEENQLGFTQSVEGDNQQARASSEETSSSLTNPSNSLIVVFKFNRGLPSTNQQAPFRPTESNIEDVAGKGKKRTMVLVEDAHAGQVELPTNWVIVDPRTLPSDIPEGLKQRLLSAGRVVQWSAKTGSIASRSIKDGEAGNLPQFPRQPGPELPTPPETRDDIEPTRHIRVQYLKDFERETGRSLLEFVDAPPASGGRAPASSSRVLPQKKRKTGLQRKF